MTEEKDMLQEEQETEETLTEETELEETDEDITEDDVTEEEEEEEEEDADDALEQERERYLRLFAEFDNFRKRTAKEKLEAYTDATARCIGELLPVVDRLAIEG